MKTPDPPGCGHRSLDGSKNPQHRRGPSCAGLPKCLSEGGLPKRCQRRRKAAASSGRWMRGQCHAWGAWGGDTKQQCRARSRNHKCHTGGRAARATVMPARRGTGAFPARCCCYQSQQCLILGAVRRAGQGVGAGGPVACALRAGARRILGGPGQLAVGEGKLPHGGFKIAAQQPPRHGSIAAASA